LPEKSLKRGFVVDERRDYATVFRLDATLDQDNITIENVPSFHGVTSHREGKGVFPVQDAKCLWTEVDEFRRLIGHRARHSRYYVTEHRNSITPVLKVYASRLPTIPRDIALACQGSEVVGCCFWALEIEAITNFPASRCVRARVYPFFDKAKNFGLSVS
jgi:hypothetical protein